MNARVPWRIAALAVVTASVVDSLAAELPGQVALYAGPSDQGAPGLPCKSCHGNANVVIPGSRIASIPGNPRWSLAPASMAWEG